MINFDGVANTSTTADVTLEAVRASMADVAEAMKRADEILKAFDNQDELREHWRSFIKQWEAAGCPYPIPRALQPQAAPEPLAFLLRRLSSDEVGV